MDLQVRQVVLHHVNVGLIPPDPAVILSRWQDERQAREGEHADQEDDRDSQARPP
jgi:heme-degrading monooxygenase HmoA